MVLTAHLKPTNCVKVEMADVKTLIVSREASMQRWLLGITSTTMVAIAAVLNRTLA